MTSQTEATAPKAQHGDHKHGEQGMWRASLFIHDRVFEQSHREIADWLGPTAEQSALDAGCGVGGMTAVLAERGSSVVAVDLNEDGVEHTLERVREAGTAAQVDALVADMTALDFEDATFDLVWCSRTVHHLPDMLAGVRELARVTKPGGTVAVREGGFGFRVLPDDIELADRWLEDRLAALGVARFARPREPEEGSVPYAFGWAQLLKDAGLDDVRAKTFGFDALSPLSADEEAWVRFHWERWLGNEEWRERVDPRDLQALETLLDPASPHFVFARTDLHLRAGLTVYAGTKG